MEIIDHADHSKEEISQKIVGWRASIEQKADQEFDTFDPAAYISTDNGSGTDWRVKIRVGNGNNDYIHSKLYETETEVECQEVETGKSLHDPLD